jgi:hypothetical protein
MRNVTITLAAGLALVVAVCALTLTRSPPRVVLVGARDETVLTRISGDLALCQENEALPAGVSAIRLATWAFLGYDLRVRVYQGLRLLTEGQRGANWTSDSVTVPVKPLDYPTPGVTLCFAIGPNEEPGVILGTPAPPQASAVILTGDVPTPAAASNEVLRGRVGVEYLASGAGSWWSRLPSVVTHVGLGRAFSGTWIAFMIAALVSALGGLAVWLTLRELP